MFLYSVFLFHAIFGLDCLGLALSRPQVLLKNLGGTTLPLSAAAVAAAGAPVVLIGPCLEVWKGGYSQGGSQGQYTGTTAAAIGSYLGDNRSVTVVAGCGVPDPEGAMGKRKPSPVDCPADPRALAAAVRAAARPGAAVLVAVGIGLGRIAVSEREASNVLLNLV